MKPLSISPNVEVNKRTMEAPAAQIRSGRSSNRLVINELD